MSVEPDVDALDRRARSAQDRSVPASEGALAHGEERSLTGEGEDEANSPRQHIAAPRGRGSLMDSRSKPDLGVPQGEMPTIRLKDQRVRRANRGLVLAVVALAAAAVVLAAWIFVDRSGTSGAPSEAAPPSRSAAPATAPSDRAARIEGMISALNAGDLFTVSRSYAKDAVLTYLGGHVVGRDAITQYNVKAILGNDMTLELVDPTIGYDDQVATFIRAEDPSGVSVVSLHTFLFRGQKILDHKAGAAWLQCW